MTTRRANALSSPHEDIQRLAYRFWEERGCPIDSPDIDWYRAEHELSEGQPAPDADGAVAPPQERPARARAGSRQKAEHNT